MKKFQCKIITQYKIIWYEQRDNYDHTGVTLKIEWTEMSDYIQVDVQENEK